jgi:hypothetical protein
MATRRRRNGSDKLEHQWWGTSRAKMSADNIHMNLSILVMNVCPTKITVVAEASPENYGV